MPRFGPFLAVLLCCAGPLAAQAPQARVGMVFDRDFGGPQQRLVDLFQKELTQLTRGDFDLVFAQEDRVYADGSAEGVRRAVGALLQEPIDLLVAVGPLAAHTVGHWGPLTKPVIAPLVFSPSVQGIPQEGNSSGVANLNYLTFPADIAHDLETSRRVAPFERVALLVDRPLAETLSGLWDHYARTAAEIGVETVLVPVDGEAGDVLRRLPADIQAVLAAFPLALPPDEFDRFVEGLAERRLPSFSALGLDLVHRGFLAALHPATDSERLVRQVALNAQRILLGEDAASLPVFFERRDRLTINMQTARAIGLSPSWAVLTEAELLHRQRDEVELDLDIGKAVRLALEADLDLRADSLALEAGDQQVAGARAALLPSLDLGATGVLLDRDLASPAQPEKSLGGSATLSQVVFSDGALANWSIEKHAQAGREADHVRRRLDLIQQAATAYLDVLRAKTFERVQQQNLDLSAANLELAQVRLAVGASGRADVYRWESLIASARRDLIAANARRNLAEIALNRLLRRPLEEPFSTAETGLFDEHIVTRNDRFRRYMENPRNFRVMREFMVEEGLAAAPELRQLDSAIAAAERGLSAARRAFFFPTLALQGQYSSEFAAGGAGSEIPFDENNWNLGLNLSFPLYGGGAKPARSRAAAAEAESLRLQRRAAAEGLEQRIRSALHLAGASYAGITLSADAAVAANRNLELVKDAYGRGTLPILSLLDAQNAALLADENAANAVYDFIIDLMEVERSMGKFYLFASPAQRQEWFDRLEAYYADRP